MGPWTTKCALLIMIIRQREWELPISPPFWHIYPLDRLLSFQQKRRNVKSLSDTRGGHLPNENKRQAFSKDTNIHLNDISSSVYLFFIFLSALQQLHRYIFLTATQAILNLINSSLSLQSVSPNNSCSASPIVRENFNVLTAFFNWCERVTL